MVAIEMLQVDSMNIGEDHGTKQYSAWQGSNALEHNDIMRGIAGHLIVFQRVCEGCNISLSPPQEMVLEIMRPLKSEDAKNHFTILIA